MYPDTYHISASDVEARIFNTMIAWVHDIMHEREMFLSSLGVNSNNLCYFRTEKTIWKIM